MRGSKSSAASPRSSLAAVARYWQLAWRSVIGIGAAWWCFAHGYSLYYGDAEAHLNIARRILDSRTPGPDQIGTVWLPLPHFLLIPFVMRDAWWHSGLAGVFPSVACFVIAGMFLFSAARRVYGGSGAALAVVLLFALNPNILYLQATPMTELPFLASLAALLWATLWFRDSQSLWAVLIAAAASNAASLTRYEGWFLIPFVCLYLLVAAKKKWYAILFAVLAAAGTAGMARAQSVLLQQRSRVLQRTVFRGRHLPAPACAGRISLSRRSRLDHGRALLLRRFALDRRMAAAGSGDRRNVSRCCQTCLVGAVPAASPAPVLCLEHALLGHAHLCSRICLHTAGTTHVTRSQWSRSRPSPRELS